MDNTTNDLRALPASASSVMRWTRNTIFKVRCVIAEMREIGPWVDSLAMPGSDPVELAKYSKALKRDLLRGHWWKLRSLAKELPLALVMDTPGLRTVWRAWKNFSHNTATPEPDDERAHGMAATVLEGTARNGDTRKCAETISKSAAPGDSRKDGIHSQNEKAQRRPDSAALSGKETNE